MADTTARALRVLELLQSAQQRTVAELADRLGVDERTIRRDMSRLVDLGLPVETLRGRYGGYRLAPGRRVLPLMFSAEEAVAVYLGLVRAQAASGEPEIAAQTALSKIRRALPTAGAERVDALLGVMARTSQHGDAAPDPAVMLTLAEAVARRQALDLRYVSRDGVSSRRAVHPYGLVAHSNRWYLVAFDTERQEERTFRVDRVRAARSLRETFTPPDRPDAEGHLLDLFADADYRWQVVLRIRTTEDRIRVHLPRSVARLERQGRGEAGTGEGSLPWYRAEIHAESLDWLPSVIAALDCEVTIEGPGELRDRVRAAAARMTRAAGDDVRPTGP
ncbi:YafY family transcriptional regulator [Desertihabitans brevis]|uniref:YafY family transcriptional regulator n=1 Tax=Desertihabitans brevis TaxID=2268447 RepID=A0A367YUN7_9ACTN|nr:YafY family protein [Desertihabitans brevis]RCK68681.1 YafY family transcriptional regulator [Desertihabitans brevis]